MNNLTNFVSAAQSGIEDDGAVFSALFNLADFGKRLPNWWSKARDEKMRSEWRDGTILAGLMYAASTKIVNMPVRVVARDPNIASHQRLAAELTEQFSALSEFGNGLDAALTAFSEDYLATDNGGFLEIVGPGNKSQPLESVPLGVRHLDSLHCTRMSDPLLPVEYMDSKGKKHKFHHSRILGMNQLAASRRDMNGVGFCAVSRSIEVAVRFQDANRYVRAKMGGTSAKKMLVGKNITGKEIIKAMVASTAMVNELGDIDTDTIAIGGQDVEVSPVDLYYFPEFSEEDQLNTIMTILGLSWGLEFNEVMAVITGKAADEVALQRSRGRLQTIFAKQFSRLATYKLVPRQLKVEIDFSDDFLDQQREIIADIRARNLQRMVEIGVLTPQSARRRLLTDGYISDSDNLDMCLQDGVLPDGTEIGRVFWDPGYTGLLTVPRDLLYGTAEPETALKQIATNRFAIMSLFPLTNATNRHVEYKIALGALAWLEKIYNKAVLDAQMQQAEEQQEERPEEETPEEEPAEEEAPPDETKAVDDDIDDMIAEVVGDFYSKLSTGGDENELRERLERALIAAYLLASGLDEPDPEGKALIKSEVDMFLDSYATIKARAANGTDMLPTAERMGAQVGRTYWSTYMEFAGDDAGDHRWELGETEEHCEDCAGYAAAGPKPMAFWKAAYDKGHYPQSPALSCHGVFCSCRLRGA